MTFNRYIEITETGTIETITCEGVPPYTIIQIFGDELPFNMLKSVYDTYNDNGDGYYLEVKKIIITGSEEQLIVASIGNIQMLEKKYSIHHSCDMFHFLGQLEDEEEEKEWSLLENQRCWGNLIDEEFPDITAEQKKCLLNIAREVDFIDIKPYSHNIVGMELGFLEKAGFDKFKMKEVIKLFGLEDKGWRYLLEDR